MLEYTKHPPSLAVLYAARFFKKRDQGTTAVLNGLKTRESREQGREFASLFRF